MKNKCLAILLLVIAVFQVFMLPAVAAQPVEMHPYYTGVSTIATDLSIENSSLGLSKNRVVIIMRSGYTAEVSMTLKQISSNGVSEVKSWNDSLDGTGEIVHYYYIPSGYNYTLIVSIDVYDTNGDFVETIATNDSEKY